LTPILRCQDACAVDYPTERGPTILPGHNTRELVAATCIVPKDYPDLFLPDKLWRLTPQRTAVTAEYVHFLLSHGPFRRTLTKAATGTSGSMLNISQQKLMAHTIPLPPTGLQREFTKKVEAMNQILDRMNDSRREVEDLLRSISHAAFHGA